MTYKFPVIELIDHYEYFFKINKDSQIKLIVRRAAQMEKFFKQNRNNSTFKLEAETAYSCVEMLLHAG